MKFINALDLILNIIGNGFTIGASGIAIYLFIFKREKIKSVFDLLMNYSNQISISEVRYKLERLNDYDVNYEEQKKIVINILSEIEGQIKGNKILRENLNSILKKMQIFIYNTKTLTEPKKRSLISELREELRHIDVNINGNQKK